MSKLAVAEAAKIKKFSDRGPQRPLRSLGWGGGGAKSGGCPTPADSHFLSASSIERKIAKLCKGPFQIHLHENKTTFLRVEKKAGIYRFHMHRLFTDAPTPVLEAVVRFARKNDPKAKATIQRMAHLYFTENRLEPLPLSSKGSTYDLQQIYTRLRKKYFSETYDASIGWAERRSQGKYRSITFGSYDRHRHQIKINPLLDHPEVPLFFLEFVVYHEMLHAVCEPITDNQGRTWVHTKEFKAKEKLHPFFESAKEWEKKSLKLLKRVYGRA
ncbi:MAG TPA: hypothetical protein VHL30_02825 [Chlamydiales bacterium]|nr:hypothetical protein [Chlamydiales bacterium]